jgi:dihydroflavonol-4-reductase
VLGPDVSSSIALIRMMLNGSIPGAPRIHFGVVDVRDVADLHLLAMTHPSANSERFIAVAGRCISIIEIARLLKTRLGAQAAKVPRHQFPDFVVRLFGLFNPSARAAVPQLGVIREASSEKARTLLGWRPRPNEETILATAESLVRLKLLKTS